MGYNTILEMRITKINTGLKGLEIKKMFGGVVFMINGNMFCEVNKDYLILRLSEEYEVNALKNLMKSRPFDITGRPMKGWIMVAPEGIPKDDRNLKKWISRTREFALSLPPK